MSKVVLTGISGPGMGKIIFGLTTLGSVLVWVFDNPLAPDRMIETIGRAALPIIVWMANDFIVIDTKKRRIIEGYSFFWLRILPIKSYEYSSLEKIFVNEVDGYFAGSRPRYKAFLKTTEGDKFEIAVGSTKQRVMAKASAINAVLHTEIVDNTGG